MSSLVSGFKSGSWLHKDRILVYPILILVLTVASTAYVLISNGGLLPNGSPFGSDFVSFWVAAREALIGNAHVPYDRTLFEPVQTALFPESGYFAFFYPPHYLAYMLPLGLVGYYPALLIWMVLTFASVAYVLTKITGSRREIIILALAFPAAFLTIAHGQNAFLSAALFAGALYLLRSKPIIAGILFGLLTFKPQLGLLIPLALIAGGYWKTVFSAGITLVVAIAMSALMFGIDIWTIFMLQSGYAVETMREGLVSWEKMISPYAALRLAGIPDIAANILHWSVAIIAAAAVIWAWLPRTMVSFEVKAALLLTAALIATPFGLNYDLFLLAPAMAFFAARGNAKGFLPYEKTIIAITYMSPILMLLFMSNGISLAPLFTIIFAVLVLKRAMHEAALPRVAVSQTVATE